MISMISRMTALKAVSVLLVTAWMLQASASPALAARRITLMTDARPGPATQHGLSKLREAFKDKSIAILSGLTFETAADSDCVVVGLASGNGPAAGLLKRTGAELADDSESLLVRHVELQQRPGLLVAGSEDRGLMYAYPYRHFPTTRGWVERQRQEDLPDYAKSLPSDTEQFLSMEEATRPRFGPTSRPHGSIARPKTSCGWSTKRKPRSEPTATANSPRRSLTCVSWPTWLSTIPTGHGQVSSGPCSTVLGTSVRSTGRSPRRRRR